MFMDDENAIVEKEWFFVNVICSTYFSFLKSLFGNHVSESTSLSIYTYI